VLPPTWSRFWFFVAVSLAVHTLVVTRLPRLIGPTEHSASVLSVQLVAPDPPPPIPAPTPPKPAARKSPQPPAPPRPASPRPVQAPEPALPRPVEAPEPAAITVPEPEIFEAVAESMEQSAPESILEPPSVAQAPEVTTPEEPVANEGPNAATEPVRDLPQSGSISYVLFLGENRFSIGRTVQTWEIGTQTYRLSSSSETTGLAGFLRPYQLGYVSEGRVDASGLRPQSFSVRRGRDGAPRYAVRFDWAAKELTLGPISAPRKVALAPGTLDLLSFIFQLARAPLAPGRLQLNITTGNKIENYTLIVGTEEDIEVPLGTMRTIPVRQVRIPGRESIEIWLAPERQYLPVRIRFLDRNGEMSGEQVAADIATDARTDAP